MSERAAYLRDQADKCRWHADHLTDAETKVQLRKLASEYIERAAKLDKAEKKATDLKSQVDATPRPDPSPHATDVERI
jgi:Uri superfamily endonuclease